MEIACSRDQARLLREFTRLRSIVRTSIVDLAKKFKECVDAGLDMSQLGISRKAAETYLIIAEGRLIQKAVAAQLPDAHVHHLAALPKAEQERLWKNGARIWRRDSIASVVVPELTASEVRRLIHIPLEGAARVLSPEEQREKLPSADWDGSKSYRVELRLTAAEAVAARHLADKRRMPLNELLRELVMRAAAEDARGRRAA
jgi:hypothetical protein